MRKFYYLLIALLFVPVLGLSQFINGNEDLQNGLFLYTCGNVDTLFDSGGDGADYGEGENIVMTICPSVGTQYMGFEVVSAQFGAGDQLCLYDGNSTAGTPITCLNSSTPVNAGDLIAATVANVDQGCVTLHFTSDSDGDTGNFSFNLLCTAPCQVVDADVTTSTPQFDANGYSNIVVGEQFCIEATGVYPQDNVFYDQDDATSTFIWSWGDGTFDTSRVACHTYTTIGIYIISLEVIDDNGCSAVGNQAATPGSGESIKVRVFPIPDLDVLEYDEEICLGDTVDIVVDVPGTVLGGQVLGPTLYTANSALVVDTVFLPDNSDGISGNGIGETTIYPLLIGGYLPGATLTDVNDLFEACLAIEHSFVGDLDIILRCPNGQETYLIDMDPPGTPGNDLGIPGTATVPGTPFWYCWDPDATNTPIEEGMTYATPIPADSYQIAGNWNDLLGCPLNGEWEIIVFDDYGGDDGWTFAAEITFNPVYLEEIDSFEVLYDPIVTWDAEPTIVSSPLNQNSMQAVPTASGTYTYTCTVTDNVGHQFPYDFDVYVKDLGVSAFFSDTTICEGQTIELGAEVDGADAFYSICTYTLDMVDSWGDGWNGGSLNVLVDGVSVGTFAATGNGSIETFDAASGASIELVYTSGGFENENTYDLLDPSGAVIFSDGANPATGSVYTTTASCPGGALPYYTPSATNTFISDTLCDYTLDMVDSWGDGWNGGSLNVLVGGVSIGTFSATGTGSTASFSTNFGEDVELVYSSGSFENENTYTLTGPLGTDVFSDGPNPAVGSVFYLAEGCVIDAPLSVYYTWDPSNTVDPNTGDPSTVFVSPTTNTTYTVTGELSDGCSYTDVVNVNVQEVNYTITPNTTICEDDDIQLEVVGGSSYDWTPTDGSLSNTTISNPVASPTNTTNYYVDITENGCTLQDSVLITVQSIFAEINGGNLSETICDGSQVSLTTDDNAGWTYTWTGPENHSGASVSVGSSGTYTLTYNDGLCEDVATIDVIVNPVPQLDFTDLRNILCCQGDEVVIDAALYADIAIDEVHWDGTLQTTDISVYSGDLLSHDIYVVANGCNSDTVQLTFDTECISNPSIVVPDLVFAENPTEMNVTFDEDDGSSYLFDWQDASLFQDNTVQNAIFEGVEGEYTLEVEIIGNYVLNNGETYNECSEFADVLINVIFVGDPEIPNAFTPNGDGLNDLFIPVNIAGHSELVNFRIYDRWGELMYQYETGSQGWDGTYKGEMQPTGVYTYFVEVLKPNGDNYLTEGTITLLK